MKIKEVTSGRLTAVYCKNDQKIGVYDNTDPEGLMKLLGVEVVQSIEVPGLKKEADFPYHIDNLPGRTPKSPTPRKKTTRKKTKK